MAAQEVDVVNDELENGCYFVLLSGDDDDYEPGEDNILKIFRSIFKRQSMKEANVNTTRRLFILSTDLCPQWSYKQNIFESINGRYNTIFYVENNKIICIMSIDIDTYKNPYKLNIVFACCQPGSRKSNILLEILKNISKTRLFGNSNGSIFLSATDDSLKYWKHQRKKFPIIISHRDKVVDGGKRKSKHNKYRYNRKSKRKFR